VKIYILLFVSLYAKLLTAQFAPPAGYAGSTAIYKDSTIIKAWATGCKTKVGYIQSNQPSWGLVATPADTDATGKAQENGVISLGDGGSAILTFNTPIADGPGWDFCVFENAFIDSFLELAYVDVSSDGTNYYRFNSISNSDTTAQCGTFGTLNTAKINNLAGKYLVGYGTPFDLSELKNISALNTQKITHVRITDVTGRIDSNASRDSRGVAINDPWPTPFNTGGFDLDAVGVINQVGWNAVAETNVPKLLAYPNPAADKLYIQAYHDALQIMDIRGVEVLSIPKSNMEQMIDVAAISNGVYILVARKADQLYFQKIIIRH
jgi:hypothetical protein